MTTRNSILEVRGITPKLEAKKGVGRTLISGGRQDWLKT